MLSDSSLTNIFLVSGVSQIRYRVYCQSCERSKLADFLKCEAASEALRYTPSDDAGSKREPDLVDNTLIKAFRDLIQQNIPCLWHKASAHGQKAVNSPDDQQSVQLELWVFWFDERHTGLIDSNEHLKLLEEIKMGTFTWESAVSRGLSPTSSPGRTLAQTSAPAASVTVSKEYKLFIKSVRNMIRRANLCKGAIPLGEYFIFESNSIHYNTERYGLPAKSVTSMVACTYNVYLTNGTMVFQPEVRRIALRPLTSQDIQSEREVIVCPSGERVTLSPSKHDLPQQIEDEILRDWSKLLEIPFERVQTATRNLPRTISIRSREGDDILYPSSLIFAPATPALLSGAGYGDIYGYAYGATEDLGQLWSRWAWTERISELMKTNEPPSFSTYDKTAKNNEARLNFWSYESPQLTTVTSVLENLSQNDPSSTHALLTKALAESVSTSPLMFSKAVATPASSGTKLESITDEMVDDISEKKKSDRLQQQSQLSLVEFARLHFPGEKQDEQTVTPNAAYSMTSGTPMDISGDGSASRRNEYNQDNIMSTSFAVPNVANSSLNALNTMSQNSSVPMYQSSPVTGANEAFDLGLGMGGLESSDNMMYGMSNDWGDMADLDNLDINITEEDFDFFKSEPAKQPEMFVDPAASNDNSGFNQPQPMQVDDANIATLMHMETMPVQEIGNSAMPAENEALDLDSLFANSGQMLDNSLLVSGSNTFQDTKVIAAPASTGQGNFDAISVDVRQGTGMTPVKMEITPGADEDSVATPRYSEIKGENSFVPPDFAPVKFSEGVNDSKYSDGGKFMFLPSTVDRPELKGKRQKREIYRPDYTPRFRKRLKARKPEFGDQRNGKLNNASKNMPYRLPNAFGQELDDSSSDTSTSDYESSSESDASYSADSKEKQEPGDWLDTVHHAQAVFAEYLLDKSKSLPFRPWSNRSDLSIKVAWQSRSNHKPLREESQEDSKVLEYFCQQVVMGGYPFTSGLTSVFANGGIISEGETARGIISRNNCVSQLFNDDVIRFSSSPSDYDHVSQEFKNVLGEVFERKVEESNAAEQDTGLKQPSFPGSVCVKGPLTIQQYYDLSETNQAHSKYGKYQVKKRRPAEPNFDVLSPPDVVVSRSDEYIEGSPKMVAFWEKLRLEPYSARKNISYFVVYPTNEHLEGACAQFFKALSSTYETCLLGSHHPGNIGPYRRGLVPVPLLPASPNETWTERQIRSYMAECQNLGSALSAAMAEKMNIVIYIVDPTDRQSSSLDLSRCFHKLMISYHAATVGISMRAAQENRMRLAMQLVPIEHVLRPSAFGGFTKFGLKEIAFSVYSKCHAVVGRDHGQIGVEDTRSIAATYTPPFVLAKPIPERIKYTLSKPLMPFPTIMDQNATLHLSYSFSLDRRWLVLVWTDNEGEFLEFSVIHVKDKPLSLLFEDAWSRTLQISKKAILPWSFVIAKNGLLFEQELQAWTEIISNDKKVAIVGVNMQSSFHIQEWTDNQQQQYMSSNVDYPQTPGSSVNTPTPENFGTPTSSTITTVGTPTMRAVDTGASTASTEIISNGDTRALVLNHRVAYSSKRTHPENDDESWILPLASGYLIQPTPSMNPINREQFTSTPTVTEIHLVHNQTSHSAYSALRDIIKRFHALSYVNMMPSNANCLPIHLVITERLTRTLLLVHA